MATFINERFFPFSPVTAEEVSFTSGATALISALSLCIVDEDESLLLGMPNYGSFGPDLQTLSKYDIIETRN